VAVTDEEFQELAVKVEGLSSRVRTLEDDRAIDRAEAQVRHRALIDSMQALRVTQVEQGRDIARLRTDMQQGFAAVSTEMGRLRGDTEQSLTGLRGDMEQGFEAVSTEMGRLRGDTEQGLTGLRGDMEQGFTAITGTLSHVVRLLGGEPQAYAPG